jgi:prepilin peptidase CpaA
MNAGQVPLEVIVVVLLASAVAALTDVWRFKVYNLLTFPVLAAGIIYHAIVGGWSGLGGSVAGAVFGLIVFLVPYMMGGMGAGDVKFVAALGAWLGVKLLAVVVFFGCMATGIYAMSLVYRTGGFRQLWLNLQVTIMRCATVGRFLIPDDKIESVHDWTNSAERRTRLIPFSAMIAVGVLITFTLAYTVFS